MSGVLAELPVISDHHQFHETRWVEVLGDETLASLEQRVETDCFGNVVMRPLPGFGHSRLKGRIMDLLRESPSSRGGRVLPKCPLSTKGGVKSIDVVWISQERIDASASDHVLFVAPELCIEILSPGNTRNEMDEKKRLFWEAGAVEVWFCDREGQISFYRREEPDQAAGQSFLFPEFVARIEG
ncbi:MAG: Uma2 family endonuclease [Verrucomicrobiota bacterium]